MYKKSNFLFVLKLSCKQEHVSVSSAAKIFRMFIAFDAYVLLTLAKRIQNWIVSRLLLTNFTVALKNNSV